METDLSQGLIFERTAFTPGRDFLERCVVPPFSLLNAQSGDWIARKEMWKRLGIRGELGRAEDLVYSSAAASFDYYRVKEGKRYGTHRAGSSIFDPVLCEVVYRWFCPPGGHVLDPFAGEATKGLTAAILGFEYTGVELREEQVHANEAQARALNVKPRWIIGDSARIGEVLPPGEEYDLVFTSPPYYDLETYSARAEDGSALPSYKEFMRWYAEIFRAAVARLRLHRFLVVKVGEIRDEAGIYRNFVGHNVWLFTDILGLKYYNELILATVCGTAPMRASRPFRNRKITKTHQNILVFLKGDPRRIQDHFPVDRAEEERDA